MLSILQIKQIFYDLLFTEEEIPCEEKLDDESILLMRTLDDDFEFIVVNPDFVYKPIIYGDLFISTY